MKQRLIDANTVGAGMAETWQKVIVKMEVDRASTVDIESLPLVIQLRHRIKTLEYGLDIAQNGEKNLKHQLYLVEQELADVRKRLKRSESEREAAVSDMVALMWHSGDGCEICKHKVVEQRHPYTKLGCDLGNGCNCEPEWQGMQEE